MVRGAKVERRSFDQRGWIPGPQENAEAFFARIERLERFFSHPPEAVDHFLTDTDWEGAKRRVDALYRAKPDWIVAHYDNRGLYFFQGAATWIVEEGELRIPLIQLKTGFDSGSLFKLYSREEVLAHECVHAMRMQFDEPQFEEIFAYRTSRRAYRRFLGPLFQKPWEATVFLLTLLLPISGQMALFFDPTWEWACWLGGVPLLFLGWLVCRLAFLHLVLRRALRKMRGFLQRPQLDWAVALRMTDAEIFGFAFASKEALAQRVCAEKSFRWALLRENFFKKIHDWK